MSDQYSNTGEEQMTQSGSSRCRFCNPSGVPVVVYPWKGQPITLEPNLEPPSNQMFIMPQGTDIKIKSVGRESIHIHIVGDPVTDLGGILNNIDLAITPSTLLELVAGDLVQITFNGVVSRYDPGHEVKCGEG